VDGGEHSPGVGNLLLIDYDERVSSDLAKEIASSSHLVPGPKGARCRIENSSRGTFLATRVMDRAIGVPRMTTWPSEMPCSSEPEETAAAN
jgi:hypothetical protein